MALDFPASPNLSDTYTYGGITWTWDGTTWKVLGKFQSESTETDPIFNASPASDILQQNITNWNTAYGWGNHATAGYLSAATSINALSDVTISTLSDGQLLRYSVAAGQWQNWTPNYLTSYTETDPVFSASVAAGITSTNTSNWNTAYNWGNHASANYIADSDFTSTGLMKRGATSGSYSVITDNSTNWNTAYSWGNHATQGYITGIGSFSIQALNDVTVTSPTDGQVLKWNAATSQWINGTDNAGTGGGGANVTISDTAPGSASAGDLWWESDTGRLKIYYNDTDSNQWVDASPPLQQDRIASTGAPATATSTGTAGEIRYDANYVYICVATNTWKRAALTTW